MNGDPYASRGLLSYEILSVSNVQLALTMSEQTVDGPRLREMST